MRACLGKLGAFDWLLTMRTCEPEMRPSNLRVGEGGKSRAPVSPAPCPVCTLPVTLHPAPSTLLGLPQEGKGAVRQELLPLLLSGLSFLPSETGLGFFRPSGDPFPSGSRISAWHPPFTGTSLQ